MVKGKIVYKEADYKRVGKSYKNEEYEKSGMGNALLTVHNMQVGKVDIMVGTKLMLNMMLYNTMIIEM